MTKLSIKQQKWLKLIHILFACLWVGGSIAVTLMHFLMNATDGMQLYGINLSMKFVDDFIIIPGATGSFLTGLLYSIFTKWGWFKHRWITIKWIINLYGVVFGTICLGPWLNSLPPIAKKEGLNALTNITYINNQKMLCIWGSFQAITIIFAVYLSILKPWRKTRSNSPKSIKSEPNDYERAA
ncbi:MAG: hypothetical protein GY714_29450 [Desulfobacterales bacterium]|nr:hypothetical protein [Desulfobacterales bacterium]